MRGCSLSCAPARRTRRLSSSARNWPRMPAASSDLAPELSMPWAMTTPSTTAGNFSKMSLVTRRAVMAPSISPELSRYVARNLQLPQVDDRRRAQEEVHPDKTLDGKTVVHGPKLDLKIGCAELTQGKPEWQATLKANFHEAARIPNQCSSPMSRTSRSVWTT